MGVIVGVAVVVCIVVDVVRVGVIVLVVANDIVADDGIAKW